MYINSETAKRQQDNLYQDLMVKIGDQKAEIIELKKQVFALQRRAKQPDYTYTNLGQTLRGYIKENRSMKQLFDVYKATKAYAGAGGSLAGAGIAKPPRTVGEYLEDTEESKMPDILKSKKFQAALVGLIVAVVGKVGLELDEQSLLAILSPILTYIAGQAAADIGKEAAKVKNGN